MLKSLGNGMEGPWAWRSLGGKPMLLADHGRRRVILCDARTCEPETGLLEPADPSFPAMAAIEAVPEMREALAAIYRHTHWRDDEISKYVAGLAQGALARANQLIDGGGNP